MEFRCDASPDGSGRALQFIGCNNEGICNVSVDGLHHFCSCPPGWVHDFTGFAHFDNCTMPEDYLLVYFIVYSCLCLPLILAELILMYRSRESLGKHRPKLIKIMTIVTWHLFNWAHVFSVYIQNGFFEAAAVTLCIYLTLGYVTAAQTVSTFLEPLHMIRKYRRSLRSSRRLFWGIMLVMACVTSSIVLAGIPFCRDPFPSVYNAIMFAMMAVSVINIACTQAALIILARRVERMIVSRSSSMGGGSVVEGVDTRTKSESASGAGNNTLSSGRASQMQAKLRLQLRFLITIALTFTGGTAFTLAILCVWAVYGSFPYLYIGWSVQFIFGWTSFPLTFSMLSRLPPSTLSRDDSPETNTPPSMERRGVETIVIQNRFKPTPPSSKGVLRLSRNLVGSRARKQSNSQKQILSKIVEEGQSQVESRT